MKIVPLSKARTNLSRYGELCRREPVVVTVDGVPAFQLVPIEGDEDLIDALIQDHPEFRGQLQERVKVKPIPWKKARKELGLSS